MTYKHKVQQHGKDACCWKVCRWPIGKTQSRTAHWQKSHHWTQRLRLRLVEQVPHIRTKLPPGSRWLRYKGGGAGAGVPPGWFLALDNESHGVPNQTLEPAKIFPRKCWRRWLLWAPLAAGLAPLAAGSYPALVAGLAPLAAGLVPLAAGLYPAQAAGLAPLAAGLEPLAVVRVAGRPAGRSARGAEWCRVPLGLPGSHWLGDRRKCKASLLECCRDRRYEQLAIEGAVASHTAHIPPALSGKEAQGAFDSQRKSLGSDVGSSLRR